MPADRRQLLRDDLQRLQDQELQERLDALVADDWDLGNLAEGCQQYPAMLQRLDELESADE